MVKFYGMVERLYELDVKLSKLEWVQYTTGYDFGIEEAHEEINNFLKDEKNYSLVLEYMEKASGPVEKRKGEILYNEFKSYHLTKELNDLNFEIQKKTNELSKILNTFRFKIDGKEVSGVDIDCILSREDDRELRKKAFFAKNQIDKPMVDNGFIDLINLRNEYAGMYGEKDFMEYRIKSDELSPNIFDTWEDDLKEHIIVLNEKGREYARKFIGSEELMPWDYSYIKSKISSSLNSHVDMSNYYNVLREFFLNFGFDINKFNITYDIFPRKNKSEWGYNFPIKYGEDSRILANVKNQYREYEVLLHETGHGIHSFMLNPEEIILNMGISGIIEEGIADLFEEFLYDKMFYEKFFTNSVEKEFEEIHEYDKISHLRFVGNIFFDHELYKNDLKSLDDIYNLYFKVYNKLYNDKPYNQKPPFGFRIHYTTHPIYMHNYFMGDVTCSMLKKVFYRKYGVDSISKKPKEFGNFLFEQVIKPSGLYKYEELFEKISGEKFSLKWYFDKR